MVGAMGDRVMSAADALAERAGISAQYEDIWGRIHRTSGVTRDTVLAALGFSTVAEASDGAAREAAAARTLEQLDEANWSAPLPPVVVVTTDSGELDLLMTVPSIRPPATRRAPLANSRQRSCRSSSNASYAASSGAGCGCG